MKTISKIICAICILSLSFSVCIAGSLQPTSAPGPTMKTLDQVEPRIPIPLQPPNTFTITSPGSYYLQANRILLSDSGAITVDSNDVTIDLMGYTMQGNATTFPIYGTGVAINPGHKNIEIRNGTIRNFGNSGIKTGDENCSDIRVINVRCLSNVGEGIKLHGKNSRIENSLIADNIGDGIEAGENSIITNCTVRNNIGVGITIYAYSKITSCNICENSLTGIFVPASNYGCVISDNICHKNSVMAIIAQGRATVTGNTCRDNWGGIAAGGIIKDNFVSGCTGQVGDAFDVSSGSTVINNTATNNSANGFKIYIGCAVIGNSSYSNGSLADGGHPYGFEIDENCLVDQNISYGNAINMNTLVNCTVPSGNHTP